MKSGTQATEPPEEQAHSRRSLLGILLAAAIAVSACAGSPRGIPADDTANLSPEDKMLRHKFRGIYGGVLYIDASGYSKDHVTIRTQSGQMWRATPAGFGRGGGQEAFTGAMYIPRTIRVEWRTGDVRDRKDENGRSNYHTMGFEGGTILGDYTVPVIGRIPDEVLDYIRKNGGALRLKIRLKDNGVLIGWDVEERVPIPNWKAGDGAKYAIRYVLPGGDFREAQIYNGKVIDPGWEK